MFKEVIAGLRRKYVAHNSGRVPPEKEAEWQYVATLAADNVFLIHEAKHLDKGSPDFYDIVFSETQRCMWELGEMVEMTMVANGGIEQKMTNVQLGWAQLTDTGLYPTEQGMERLRRYHDACGTPMPEHDGLVKALLRVKQKGPQSL